jgi:hypothetical protein
MTIIITLLALLIFGGDILKGLGLVFGVFIGIFASPFGIVLLFVLIHRSST